MFPSLSILQGEKRWPKSTVLSPSLNTLLQDDKLPVATLIWYHFVPTNYLYDVRRDTKGNGADVEMQQAALLLCNLEVPA